jgi:hypothetical protein
LELKTVLQSRGLAERQGPESEGKLNFGWQANAISAWQSGKPFANSETGSGADNPVESDSEQRDDNNRATPLNNGRQDCPSQIKNPYIKL